MQSIVVDCSAFLACTLLDEAPPANLLEALAAARFVVPAIWPTEVGNAFLTALKKGRMDDMALRAVIASLNERELEIEAAGLELALSDALALARKFKLTVYDASYLELALRRNFPLATLDADLIKAARKAGAKVA